MTDPTINWPQMKLPVGMMRTYGLAAPQATHFRRATCQEVDCPNYANGWKSGFDVTVPEKAHAANMIRLHYKAGAFTYEELRDGAGRVVKVVFTFAAGQQCFDPHSVPLERDPIAYRRGGDFRGNPTGELTTVHSDLGDWLDDFGNHQLKIQQQYERG